MRAAVSASPRAVPSAVLLGVPSAIAAVTRVATTVAPRAARGRCTRRYARAAVVSPPCRSSPARQASLLLDVLRTATWHRHGRSLRRAEPLLGFALGLHRHAR